MGRRPGDAEGDGAGMSDKDGLDTRIVQAGRRPEWTGPLVNPPVHRASTILFDNVAEMRAAKPNATASMIMAVTARRPNGRCPRR